MLQQSHSDCTVLALDHRSHGRPPPALPFSSLPLPQSVGGSEILQHSVLGVSSFVVVVVILASRYSNDCFMLYMVALCFSHFY